MIEFEYVKDIISKNKFAIIAFLLGVISIVGSVVYVFNNKPSDVSLESKNIQETMSEKPEVKEEASERVKVDVKGSVKKAGVYELEKGSTVIDAINAAGGVTSKGSTRNINLSKRLVDEMVIYVFSKEELKKKESTNEVVCEIPKCECETVTINECPEVNSNNISNNDTKNEENDKNDNTSKKVSLNSGTKEDFMTLDGVGEAKAIAIIEYRNQNGPFQKIEDIMNVSGIGEKAFEKIKDKLTL